MFTTALKPRLLAETSRACVKFYLMTFDITNNLDPCCFWSNLQHYNIIKSVLVKNKTKRNGQRRVCITAEDISLNQAVYFTRKQIDSLRDKRTSIMKYANLFQSRFPFGKDIYRETPIEIRVSVGNISWQ